MPLSWYASLSHPYRNPPPHTHTPTKRALNYIKRATSLYKNAERLAKVMGKAEDFTKVVQKISSGIVKRAVGILSKVLRTSEANAEKIVKVRAHQRGGEGDFFGPAKGFCDFCFQPGTPLC
jgi:hypothetical protein